MPNFSSPTPVVLIATNGTVPLIPLSDALEGFSTTLFTFKILSPDCVSLSPKEWAEHIVRFGKNAQPPEFGVRFLLDDSSDNRVLQRMINLYQVLALKKGLSFVVVNLMDKEHESERTTSKIQLQCPSQLEVGVSGLSDGEVAAKNVNGLLDVLPIPERLHLIPSSQLALQPSEQKRFRDTTYCTLDKAKNHKRSEHLIFAALILTQPRVCEGKILRWTAIDHTRAADFFFRWEGESSRYTWNLVLSWKPGDRQVMPRVPIDERNGRSGLKGLMIDLPMRAMAGTCEGMDTMLGGAAKGFSGAGKGLRKMLQRKVKEQNKKQGKNLKRPKADTGKAEADENKKLTFPRASTDKKDAIVSSVEVDEAWDEKASTVAGSEYDEKVV